MYDALPEVYKKLSEIEGVKVTTQWIDGIVKLPSIVYYESENIPYDPTHTLYKVSFVVHVFDNKGSRKRIYKKVNDKLWELGFTCTSNREIFDEHDPLVYHRRLTFEGIINIDMKLVYTK